MVVQHHAAVTYKDGVVWWCNTMQQHLLEITVDCLQRPLLEVASFWNRELSMRDGGGGGFDRPRTMHFAPRHLCSLSDRGRIKDMAHSP